MLMTRLVSDPPVLHSLRKLQGIITTSSVVGEKVHVCPYKVHTVLTLLAFPRNDVISLASLRLLTHDVGLSSDVRHVKTSLHRILFYSYQVHSVCTKYRYSFNITLPRCIENIESALVFRLNEISRR